MNGERLDHEWPAALARWGWNYHHIGIPTDKKMAGERHLPQFGLHVSGFTDSPFGIEWMRFDDDSPVHPLIKIVPHIAFEVENLDEELSRRNFTMLTPPNPPSEGARVAMIAENGAPIELIEIRRQMQEQANARPEPVEGRHAVLCFAGSPIVSSIEAHAEVVLRGYAACCIFV